MTDEWVTVAISAEVAQLIEDWRFVNERSADMIEAAVRREAAQRAAWVTESEQFVAVVPKPGDGS